MSNARRISLLLVLPLLLGVLTTACGPQVSRYTLVENSLRAGDPNAADHAIQKAEDEYEPESRVLYDMDRGMTLHLAEKYAESNTHLERAEGKIEDLYTRRISIELKGFLVNDTELPFEGEPFEHVAINVTKALNYAHLQEWDDALVEARRIDHRLNVLTDRAKDKTDYQNDPFARYLSGILYESTGDLSNAFIAYRHAYEAYRATRSWSRTPVPPMLRADLLRITDGLHLSDEHARYREAFGDMPWSRWEEVRDLAQLVVISYNGRAPRKVDEFVDLPVSMEALQLILVTKGVTGPEQSRDRRIAESALYGLSGRVVRVALPRLVPQKSEVSHSVVTVSGPRGSTEATSELAQNYTAAATKSLEERFPAIATKAVARAATKFALAEGASYGARAAGGKDYGPALGLLVGIIGKTWAVASEEADKRSWRTLPDEMQIARLWVPPGEYIIQVHAVDHHNDEVLKESTYSVTLDKGQTRFIIERVLP